MIQIRLSEIDFDYEIQALVCSFFPGQRCLVALEDAPSEDALLSIHICLGSQEIVVSVALADYFMTETASVTGEGDWHKHEDKSAHPYRTYYKNVLKKLVFLSLQNIPEGLVVVTPLLVAGVKTRNAIMIALGVAAIEMAGTIAGYYIGDISALMLPFMLSLAGGAMIYVISDEMIPETHSHGFQKPATYALVAGVMLMLFIDSLF